MIENAVTLKWNIEFILKKVREGVVEWNNGFDGGLFWTTKQNSLLIHSIITGKPISDDPFLIIEQKERPLIKYDLVDGSRRVYAIINYVDGKYKLIDVPIINANEEKLDINGLYFNQLPAIIQQTIMNYKIFICFLHDLNTECVETIEQLSRNFPRAFS
jgi:hypothetical protein